LELNKDFSTAEFQIAVTYFCLDSLEIAKNRFEKLQQIYPDKKSIYKWLGFLYGYFGENEKMLAVFKEYYDKTRKEFFKGQNRNYDLSREVGMAYALL